MKCHVLYLAVLTFAFVASPAVADSDSSNLCEKSGIIFGLFNGVQTTKEDAIRAVNELSLIHGETSSGGESVRYEVLYNYTSGFEDFVETGVAPVKLDNFVRLNEPLETLGARAS